MMVKRNYLKELHGTQQLFQHADREDQHMKFSTHMLVLTAELKLKMIAQLVIDITMYLYHIKISQIAKKPQSEHL